MGDFDRMYQETLDRQSEATCAAIARAEGPAPKRRGPSSRAHGRAISEGHQRGQEAEAAVPGERYMPATCRDCGSAVRLKIQPYPVGVFDTTTLRQHRCPR